MSTRAAVALVGLLLTVNASDADGQAACSAPLLISSLGNTFSVVGRFVGNFTVFQDSIVVEFDTLFAARMHYGGPVLDTRLDSIRVGVGVSTGESWNPVDNSAPLQVERVMPVSARIDLPRSRFVLPHVRAESDSAAWLVVTFHLSVGKPGDENYHSDATTYAHSGRGIISPPPPANTEN